MISTKNIIRVISLITVIGVAYLMVENMGLISFGFVVLILFVAGTIYKNKKMQPVKVEKENKEAVY